MSSHYSSRGPARSLPTRSGRAWPDQALVCAFPQTKVTLCRKWAKNQGAVWAWGLASFFNFLFRGFLRRPPNVIRDILPEFPMKLFALPQCTAFAQGRGRKTCSHFHILCPGLARRSASKKTLQSIRGQKTAGRMISNYIW